MAAPKIDFTNSFIVNTAERVHLSSRSPPTAPDGHYDYEAAANGETSGASEAHSGLYNFVSTAQSVIERGPLLTDSPFRTARAVNDFLTSSTSIDDRKGFFGGALAFITKLPAGAIQNKLNDAAVSTLYNTLPHPPSTFIGKVKADTVSNPPGPYGWREADGGGNNPYLPDLGRAGRPYARSVQAKHPIAPNALPDPGLVFDTLLKSDGFQPHPGRNSSLTFAFASLVTHSLFRTDAKDNVTNNTSSYLDLSPLYGCNQMMQDQVRDKAQGRGLLYPDTFSEERLFFVPPAASALLVIFSRNHNYIAEMLLKLNERKCWSDPSLIDQDARKKQDEEIFQTARLVNCGHFMSLIFGDYVAGFLGLGRDGNSWSMNPFDPITSPLGQTVGRGQGNHVSVEFNILYRWHATTAQEDIKWTEDQFERIFQGKNLAKVTLDDFKGAAVGAFREVEPDPKKRNFGAIKRDAVTGKFSDDDLANVLQTATERVAGAYRARGTPAALRIIEIMGIEQARRWGCCSMNEFRKFLGLKPFDSFKEWCSDEKIWRTAERLYGHIDNLELYTGLQAEDCMKLGPGSGICCGYTMTRAILADAIALVRGDRFYTHDYTPANLTAWGFQDCVRDPNNGAFGAALPKLLMRHLPRHYPSDSAYTLFPFFTPEVTEVNLEKLRLKEKYTFSRPAPVPEAKPVNTLAGARSVLSNVTTFRPMHEEEISKLLTTSGNASSASSFLEQKNVWDVLYPNSTASVQDVQWIKQKTQGLIKQKTFTHDGLPGKYVDINKDVITLVAVHWAADKLLGVVPKTEANPRGLYTEQGIYDMFTILFSCAFQTVEPEHGWTTRIAAQQAAKNLQNLVEKSLAEAGTCTTWNPFRWLYLSIKRSFWPKDCREFLARLSASSPGASTTDLVSRALSLAVGASVSLSQAASNVVDFYMSASHNKERVILIAACSRADKEGANLVQGFVREAMRLNPPFAGVYRKVTENGVVSQSAGADPLKTQQNDIVYVSIKNAHTDASAFPNPTDVDPKRPKSSYDLQFAGLFGSTSVDFAVDAIAEIAKIIFTLPNVRLAPGTNGVSRSLIINKLGTDNKMYVTETGNVSPWPGSLQVVYDK